MRRTTPPLHPLAVAIEAFLAETGMAWSAFGLAAMGDPKFVEELRAGRDLLYRTEQRARAQMEIYREKGRFAKRGPPLERLVKARLQQAVVS
jgi:hypothetical protein